MKKLNFKDKHFWLSIIMHASPLLLLLILPSLGISNSKSTFLAFVLMMLSHLVMMKDHTKHLKKEKEVNKNGLLQ